MPHREGIREFLKDIDLTDLVVHDWGCGQKPIIKFLPGKPKRYVGIDSDEKTDFGFGPGNGGCLADICKETVALDIKADIAFCLEVLEHTEDPRKALANIATNLKPEGHLYVSVPFMYPIHSDHDLWRYTDQGLRLLLEQAGFAVQRIERTDAASYEGTRLDLWDAGWVAFGILEPIQ